MPVQLYARDFFHDGGSQDIEHHNLVHAVQGGDVDMTIVDGKIIVENGKLLTANLQELIADMNQAVPDLFRRRAAWLAEHQSVNALKRKE